MQFEEINNIDKYHGDVLTYKVTDNNGDLVSIFYADFFPRKGKRNGAWMTSYKPQLLKQLIQVYLAQVFTGILLSCLAKLWKTGATKKKL